MAITWTSATLDDQITSTDAANRELLYTASNGVFVVEKATITSTHGSAVDVFLYIKSDATLTGTIQEIEKISVPANGSASADKLVGHKVPQNGTIQVHAGTTNVCYATISGTERTQ